MIKVERKNGEQFKVTISEQDSGTVHTVTLDDNYYQALTEARISGVSPIRRCRTGLLFTKKLDSICYCPEVEQSANVV